MADVAAPAPELAAAAAAAASARPAEYMDISHLRFCSSRSLVVVVGGVVRWEIVFWASSNAPCHKS